MIQLNRQNLASLPPPPVIDQYFALFSSFTLVNSIIMIIITLVNPIIMIIVIIITLVNHIIIIVITTLVIPVTPRLPGAWLPSGFGAEHIEQESLRPEFS